MRSSEAVGIRGTLADFLIHYHRDRHHQRLGNDWWYNTGRSAQFCRLAARRGKKRAIIPVGHSLLVAAFYIIREGVAYSDFGVPRTLTRPG
jgi:hypothetical protein